MVPISYSPALDVSPSLHNPSATPGPLSCNGGPCPWWLISNPRKIASTTALTLAIFFSAIFIVLTLNAAIRCFISSFIRRRATSPGNDVEAGGIKAVSKLVFAPGVKVGEKEETECAICLSEFVEGDVIRVLNKCKHGFHFQCVQKWLVSHSSCPTCRANCK